MRIHGNKINNRICLSFYISDNNLNLKNLAYKEDIHFYYWLLHFIPIFDNGTYEYFFEKNKWLKDYIPQSRIWETADDWVIKDNMFTKLYRVFWEKLLDNFLGRFINSFLKKLQLFKMNKVKFLKSKENNTNVVIRDDILKFHEEDNRKKIRETFSKRVSRY